MACSHIIVEDMERVCCVCGVVIGPLLVLRYHRQCSPLYIYNRVSRFNNALRKYGVTHHDSMCDVFESLERIWKGKTFPGRKYFLNIRFCVWNIGVLYNIDFRALYGPCIKDQRRIDAQRAIFCELLQEHSQSLYEAYCSRSSILSETTKLAPEMSDC